MNHDVGAVLNRADKVGSSKSVVDHHRNSMLVGDGGDGVNVRNVGVGIAERLQIDRLGVGSDGGGHFFQVVGVDKGGMDPVKRQGMRQQIVVFYDKGLQ